MTNWMILELPIPKVTEIEQKIQLIKTQQSKHGQIMYSEREAEIRALRRRAV